jgi:hypothetical protein
VTALTAFLTQFFLSYRWAVLYHKLVVPMRLTSFQGLPSDERQDVVCWYHYRHFWNLGAWDSMYREGVASEIVSEVVHSPILYRLMKRECRATQLVILKPYLSAWLCLEMALDIIICGV